MKGGSVERKLTILVNLYLDKSASTRKAPDERWLLIVH